ncbi:MAG: hypothetical protein SNJ84_09560, partial [Verrucomicrobiia bacterium]
NRERKELDQLPAQIEALEKTHTALIEQLANPLRTPKDSSSAQQLTHQLNTLQNQIEQAYARWQLLESKLNSGPETTPP